MPDRNISQANTIKIINDYLKWHNLPVQWNETGVCNGLATVHAQYTLAGKEDKFFKMLNKITDMSSGVYPEPQTYHSIEDDIDHFINQVVLAYDPHEFETNLNQGKSYQTLKVDGKDIKTDFILPLITSKNNWEHTFNELDLQSGEVVKVTSPTHAITIHKQNGQYIVFDPNYSNGKKIFQNEQLLLDELDKEVFGFSGTNLPMTLTILKKEGAQITSSRRTAAEIYKDYIKDTQDLTIQASYRNTSVTNIYFAATRGDKEIMKIALSQKDNWEVKELKDLARLATQAVNNEAFEPIFNKLQSVSDNIDVYKEIIQTALNFGNGPVFEQIIQTKAGKEAYTSMISNIKEDVTGLHASVIGGNPKLVMTVINDIKEFHKDNPSPPSMASLILERNQKYSFDRIQVAIFSGGADCLDKLLTELKKEDHSLSLRQQKDYLIFAIKQNDIRMVSNLIRHMPSQQIYSITRDLHISVNLAEKTNLHVLNTLQKHGAQFSSAVRSVMKEKASHQLGLTEALGVKLVAFAEYIQISLGLKEHLSIGDSAHFKEKLQMQKEKLKVGTEIPDVAFRGPSR